MKAITVLVVDDHEIFRHALVNIIKQVENVNVVLEASDGVEALEVMQKNSVNIALLDIEMPRKNGFETLSEIKKLYPSVLTIAVTMHAHDRYIQSMLSNNVNGYILKNTSMRELTKCFKLVLDGSEYFSKEVAARIYNGLNPEPKILDSITANLTSREIEVLWCICNQLTTEEIADKLNISSNTVKTHKLNLMNKTQSQTGIGLVLFAIKNNIFPFNIA